MVSRRRSIEIPGVAHGAPIPMGSRIDNLIFSSAIMGADPATGKAPEDGKRQVRLMFDNLRSFLEVAGCSPDDVIQVSVLLADNAFRQAINDEWIAMFPNEASRPARHITLQPLAGSYVAQIEIVAVA